MFVRLLFPKSSDTAKRHYSTSPADLRNLVVRLKTGYLKYLFCDFGVSGLTKHKCHLKYWIITITQ